MYLLHWCSFILTTLHMSEYSNDEIDLSTLELPSHLLWCGAFRLKWTPYYLQSANILNYQSGSVQFSSVAQSCPTLCNPMNRSTPGLPVHHQLPESTQTHVHWVGDAIQPSHPLLSPSPAFSLSQGYGFFQWVSSSYQVDKVLDLQHKSSQCTQD